MAGSYEQQLRITSPDAAIAAIAVAQHNQITRGQLAELGLTATQIAYRARIGRLHRVHRGVYTVGRPATTHHEKAMAAVLACRAGTLLGLRSALALWGWGRWPHTVEVLTHDGKSRVGIAVHRTAFPLAADADCQHGIPVTSPARTLLDNARDLHRRGRLVRTVNDALRSPYLSRDALAGTLDRLPTHRGTPLVRAIVGDIRGAPTRSDLEDRFVAFCRRHGLPRPQTNLTVNGLEVDAYFPAARIVVELDGYEFHGDSRFAFETDRERDAHHLDHGDETLRITDERMRSAPAREAARLARILARRTRPEAAPD